MKGRLNLFQRSMLRWRALHPYNAVHVLALPPSLDAARIEASIADVLEGWRLTGLALDEARGRYEYRGGPASFELRRHAGHAEGWAAPAGVPSPLERVIEAELNRPFARDGALDPFRFFLLEEPQSPRLGIAYDHFVAGGDSIVLLLKAIFDRCAGRAVAPAPERYPPGCARVLLRHPLALAAAIARIPAVIASCRRSARPHYADAMEGRNGFRHLALDPAATASIRAFAKRAGVTVNDVFLALALQSVASLAGERDPRERRHELGVASIMNIRGEFGPHGENAFGQFLSSFRLSHPLARGMPTEALAREIHAETAAIKRERRYLQGLVAVAASGLYWRFLPDRRRAGLHAKSYPTWAGVSNLDVNAIWRKAGGGSPPDYLRAVPTGPLAPVVFAPASAGERLNVGLSFRTSAVDPERIATMSGLFVDLIRQLSR